MGRMIDFHCHIYPEKIAQKAKDSISAFYRVDLPGCPGSAADLTARREKAGIEACVVHGVATKPEQVRSINAYLLREAAAYPGLIPFATILPQCEEPEAMVEEIVALGFRGIKLHPDLQHFAMNDPGCMRILDACRGRLLVMFHAGDERYSYSNPPQVRPVLEAFPDVTFIGAHLGGYRKWDEAVSMLAGRFENFYVDCASCAFALGKDAFRSCIEAFGTDRVLFGTDYPMWDPIIESKFMDTLGFSQAALADIMYNNAAGLLGLQ